MGYNKILLETDGKQIKTTYSVIKIHPELKCDMANLNLEIGDFELHISFDSADEMIQFCEQHNFEYNDKR